MERIKGQEEKKRRMDNQGCKSKIPNCPGKQYIFRFRMSYSSNSFFKDRVSSANIGVSHCSVIECFSSTGFKNSPQSSKPFKPVFLG
jgi:hypothetical protein